MCFDPCSLASPRKPHVYTAGELAFSTKAYTISKLKVTDDHSEVRVFGDRARKNIALHIALLFKKVLSIKNGLEIHASNLHPYTHCGFGSSAAIQTATALAINTAFGNPIDGKEIVKFLSQNYGEEIKGDNKLIHIQSNGGGPAVALKGGMVAIAGEGVIIKQNAYPSGYSFVFGIPKSYVKADALQMFKKELSVLPLFKKTSKEYAQDASYLILHHLLPAMEEGRLKDIGDVIEKYRFDYGSLYNTGKVWPEMFELMHQLKPYRKKLGIEILSTSSVGPAIYALTTNPSKAEELFKRHGLRTINLETDNQGAIIHAKK